MMISDEMKERYPEKFIPEDEIFGCIHRGDRLFVGTGCGEPQHLVRALVKYVESNPKIIYEAEILTVFTLGVAPYADEKFKTNFRHNSFFIGENTRDAVNKGLADYTPMFLSRVPGLFYRGLIPIDVALIQTSPPDKSGYMSLGISVDITRAAVDIASVVISQVNSNMPRVHGEAFVHIEDVDFVVPHDEPLLEYLPTVPCELAERIGRHVARIVEDGDTIQVGYGSIPNAILGNLGEKNHIGVHTELLTDGIVDLMKRGVVDNKWKSLNREKTVATFCMGRKSTYEYIDDNPAIEFMPIEYTNNPLVIAKNQKMTAINSALAIDLTGQATAESIGSTSYSGIGGQADFMRGAVLAAGGKTILTLSSTTRDGGTSKIVPCMPEGSGVTLNRGDIQYVVTEYGIAYLQGKSFRERAMELISIAHPDFRPWLLEKAKRLNLVYKDQILISGKEGEYPENLERYRTTKDGSEILLRPVRISDEPLLKEFFYSLSDESNYKRFFTLRRYMPHEILQKFVAIDYTRQMVILAIAHEGDKEVVVGVGQYAVIGETNTAEVAVAVRDAYQGKGMGTELLSYLVEIAKRKGLYGLTGDVFADNSRMLHLVNKLGFNEDRETDAGVSSMKITFM